mmetsp:Transcript_70035/g.154373  ORF Transcript_70035/g.154373 Transcript_70035/m.154373 type:complete len:411 (+) Transcript_70035:62-1294(+)
MYLLQGQAVQVPESDLECMLGGSPRERENSHEGRKCGWQCAAAAFVLGLLMMTVFALTRPTSLTSLTNSGVSDTVQMESMEDPVWKEVLGNKAFKQFEAERHQTAIASTQSTSTSTSAATTVATTTVATEPASTVAHSVVGTTQPAVPVLTAAPTAAPMAIATIAPSETSKIIIFGTSGKSALEQIASEFKDEAGKLDPDSEEHKSLESISKMLSKVGSPVTHAPSASPMTTANAAKPAAVSSPLAPHEALKDGNTCPSDEEESDGTCYKKCADLTGGYYPIRTSAFSCCAAEPCSFFNSKIHVGFCSGFDIAGDAEGDGCPSFEGACLLDEEMFGGLCYKKCSLFPDGQIYGHRVAPNICCSTHGFMCMLPKYFKFSADFAVGGGRGDGNVQTPAEPHLPMKQLTEMDA